MDLLRAVSHKFTRFFNKSAAFRAVASDIYKAFNRAWHTGFPHKIKSHRISG